MARRSTPKLVRRPASREPRTKFIIFCEGKKTEPSYFSAIREVYGNSLIAISTHGGQGVPLTVARAACEENQDLQKKRCDGEQNSFEDKDEIWAVFDRDEHPDFARAVDMCKANHIGVARSNPCFEVWLIQHETDYDKSDNRHEVQAFLRKLRPEYDPKRNLITRLPPLENLLFLHTLSK